MKKILSTNQKDKFSTLITESDRGCAMLALSFLDDLLKQILRKAKVKPRHTLDLNINTAEQRKLISRDNAAQLHILRELRNVPGHESLVFSFDDAGVVKHIAGIPPSFNREELRELFSCKPEWQSLSQARQDFILIYFDLSQTLQQHLKAAS